MLFKNICYFTKNVELSFYFVNMCTDGGFIFEDTLRIYVTNVKMYLSAGVGGVVGFLLLDRNNGLNKEI